MALASQLAFQKIKANPVVGPGLGTCFDVSVLREGSRYRMWFSWRDRKALALVESVNGISWTEPRVVIDAARSRWSKWLHGRSNNVSRPSVVFHAGLYHIWFCEHRRQISIAYATSRDGVRWRRVRHAVLKPDRVWEKDAVMCPCVLYDDRQKIFKMWYSGGEQCEPDAIGYATSRDGVTWKKETNNPVFAPDDRCDWERDRVTAMHVMQHAGEYYGFYIGFRDGFEDSCIGVAKSTDGVTNWRRYTGNPILTPGPLGAWDDCNVYKPFVVRGDDEWMLYYNASRRLDRVEQIGLATCKEFAFE
jgi:hypothetical protein